MKKIVPGDLVVSAVGLMGLAIAVIGDSTLVLFQGEYLRWVSSGEDYLQAL